VRVLIVFNAYLGGGNVHEGEFIEVIELTIPEMKRYITQASVKSPSSFLFGMTWFLLNKAPQP
jgi:UDP-sugar diphosphatase